MPRKPNELPKGIRWHRARIQLRYRDTNGAQGAQTFDRLADAKARQEEIRTDKRRGSFVNPAPGRHTVDELASTFLSTTGHLAAATKVKVEGHVHNHILPAFGSRQLSSIGPSDVSTWVNGLAEVRAPGTVAAVYGTFARMMKMATIDGALVGPPCIGITLPRDTGREEMRFLEPTDPSLDEQLRDGLEASFQAATKEVAS